MNSLVLRTAARLLISLLLMFSLFLLLRGHHEPGGGFIAGLVAAAAVVLFAMAYDVPSARRFLRVDPRRLIWMGLLVAMGSGVPGLLVGEPFLAGKWWELTAPGGTSVLSVGTPLIFDVGVFLVVVGVAVTLALTMAEE